MIYLITLSLEKKLLFWKKVWKMSWILDLKISTNPGIRIKEDGFPFWVWPPPPRNPILLCSFLRKFKFLACARKIILYWVTTDDVNFKDKPYKSSFSLCSKCFQLMQASCKNGRLSQQTRAKVLATQARKQSTYFSRPDETKGADVSFFMPQYYWLAPCPITKA